MNLSLSSKRNGMSAISVALVVALAAPLFGEGPDPRQRTGPEANDPAKLVTNPSAPLPDPVISGGPATAQIRLKPVVTYPGGSYNTGGYYTSANISGQRLKVGLGGSGRTYWNVQVSDWAPALMEGWQATIRNSSLLGTSADCGSGPGSCPGAGNLTYALNQSCSTSANCAGAFGEPGINGQSGPNESVCESGFCHCPFVNHARSDWTHASVTEAWGGYGLGAEGRAVWSTGFSGDLVADAGPDYYGGTVVIDVPTNARGLYRISLVAAETFMYGPMGASIPIAAMIPGELEVACLCNANVNNDAFVNGADEDIVLNCIHGNCGGCVNDCDVNCDGAVDWTDMAVTRCQILGQSNCCNVAMGGCTGMNLPPNVYDVCEVTSAATCSRYQGSYLGNGTTCAGCVCNADVDNNGMVNALDWACVVDCAKYNLCTCCVNSCDVNCDDVVDYTDLAADWCEHQGSSNCCSVAIGACTIPTGDWPDCIETSQSPCVFFGGTYHGNGSTCTEVCAATRRFEDADYCPGRVKLVRIELGSLAGISSVAVADSPPTGWTIGAISNGGSYDAVNHKVKWLFISPPFPAELTYEVTPAEAATGQHCFSGAISTNGTNRIFCGDDCLNYQCCPYITAETPQPVCELCTVGNCDECTSGACEDGSVSLCEVIAYGCAWVRGCNDDISAVTRAAFIWRNGECYCWDDGVQNYVPTACGGGTCCPGGGGAAAVLKVDPVVLASAEAVVFRRQQRGALPEWRISIDVVPVSGTSAVAAELVVPRGWRVLTVGDDGAWDRENGKIKWGPYFGDAQRSLTAAVRPDVKPVRETAGRGKDAVRPGFRGTVSFDGVNLPITVVAR